jgi:hypothetical protein
MVASVTLRPTFLFYLIYRRDDLDLLFTRDLVLALVIVLPLAEGLALALFG